VGELQKVVTERSSQGDHHVWDDAWSQSLTPWDAQEAQPGLLWALNYPEIAKHLPKGGKALVAGCGRGYDAEQLAKAGYSPSIGVDISPIAVAKAKEWFAAKGDQSVKKAVQFFEADFFKLGTSEGNLAVGTDVTVAYDYTFFCALPPSFRSMWADIYSKVIKADGVLICMVYPIHGDRPGGPPYSVSPQMYKDLLSS
ncbi:S-adenosyl-L-methionine-dependent methyltransferase, partial [Tilletiaria anomala UBC 951]